MSDQQEQVSNQISIQDLQLSLEVYEIESDQKLQKLKQLFTEKESLDLRQVFYEERSSLQVKFQNIIGDLTQFLINQEVPSTEKLRKTFYRILQSPLLLLFKVSRFEIFNLRLNAFDIQLQPIDAICELAQLLYKNIDECIANQKNAKTEYIGSTYDSYEQFYQHSKINLIQDQIFILYSYLRKGSGILKKKVQDKIKIVEIFSTIEDRIIMDLLKNQDVKTLKELSILNYEIYLVQNGFDVLCFYLKIPFRSIYKDVFKQLQVLANKAKQTCNYDMFIKIFVKFNHQIFNKINIQKIDDTYVQYIQNIATTLLQLWGCRICQFREFFLFFKALFQVHPNSKQLLQICLKHAPNLSKEDISLIRVNYRQNVQNKNVDLISLLKKVSLDDINSQLNSIYHQILSNLNFQEYTKQTIIQLLTLVNGNSSIQGFLLTVEKALREWNHTIDFNNNLKFIQSQFSMPEHISSSQVIESLKLFTNMFVLQNQGFKKQFQELISKGTITKAIIGMCKFILSSEAEITKFLQQNKACQNFVLWAFKFLQNAIAKNCSQWQQLLFLFANSIQYFTTKQNKIQIKDLICSNLQANLQNYRLGKCMRILKKTYESYKQQALLSFIVDLFVRQTVQKSKQTRNFRFFGKKASTVSKQLITKEQKQFLEKHACIRNSTIEVKQPSCFKLTELQVITNPIQFEKSMDNYYFSLDQNSKRFIQYIVEEWQTQLSSQNNLYTQIILILVRKHPVSIPIMCNIRIRPDESSKQAVQFRFVQFLLNRLAGPKMAQIKEVLSEIIGSQTIKYRDGKDYIVEQVVPMITKRALTLLNSGNLNKNENGLLSIQLYEVLAISLNRFKLTELKIDIIQKSLLKINYEIQISTCQKTVNRLSQCFDQIIKIFFRKKQLQIRKTGLEQAYEKLVWNEIRTYNKPSNSAPSKPIETQPTINQQIMVSPFTLSQQYNNEEYKIKKSELNVKNASLGQSQKRQISFQETLKSLTVSDVENDSAKLFQFNLTEQIKEIDLSKMKCDIEFHLGSDQVQLLQNKQNWVIKQQYSSRTSVKQAQNNQNSTTFVQYYLREMVHPQISSQIALKSILSYLKRQIGVSLIWNNPKNLQKLFVPLMVFFEFATSNNKDINLTENLKDQPSYWKQIVDLIDSNRIQTLKQILNLLSDLGYHNLWGQNYKSFNTHLNIVKALDIKIMQDESFLSVVLKKSLEFKSLAQIKGQINVLFDRIFTTRPLEQTSLMYKVGIDKNLLNLIMKSLQIKNLSNISFLFHSNFNNLRLYTDQLHEGLKALNMASKTRCYNQYIQLSKQTQDEQFLGPMKLFQQNFRFFIKIQKQGYNFKKAQQKKLCLQRLINVLRQYSLQKKEEVCKECDKLVEQYQQQIGKLQLSIANRVKSFYLVTKLRDLSYQNAVSVNLISQILKEKNMRPEEVLKEVRKVEIFSLLMALHTQLVRFGNSWDDVSYYQRYNSIDKSTVQRQLDFCTTRRFSHSMSKTYEKCDLQLDEVIQRCLDQLKLFFSTQEGRIYLEQNRSNFYPPFFVKSFVQAEDTIRSHLVENIRLSLEKSDTKLPSPQKIVLKKDQFISQCLSQLRNVNKKLFYTKDLITVNYQGKAKSLDQFLEILVRKMISNQTLVCTEAKDSQFKLFNKYKTSEATLEQIQLLGYCVGYCLYHKISLVRSQEAILPLHSSIIAAFSFNIVDVEDLLQVDFKVWEDVKRILSIEDSKTLNLNFSYIFENVKSLQSQRIELIDKGASKKVNNLNREQFCDAIVCQILFGNLAQQLSRFIQAILFILPKQLLSCHKLSQIYSLFYNKQNIQKVMKKYMKKIGIITPQLVFRNGKKIQNLKDYQNIQWASQIVYQNVKLRQKIWNNESNIFILTTIGGKGNISFLEQVLMIEHYQSKQVMSADLNKLV